MPRAVAAALDRAEVRGKAREKCAVFCDLIRGRRKRLRQDEGLRATLTNAAKHGVRLNVSILRRVLAERCGETKRLLMRLGVVVETTPYVPGVRSIGYWFAPVVDPTRCVKVEILDAGLRERLRTTRSDRILRSIEHFGPTYARLLQDLTRLKLSSEGMDRLDAFICEKGRHAGALPKVRNRFATMQGGWFRVGRNGRLSTHVTGCPAEIRDELLFDGEPIVEWDIPSSHPALILSQFFDWERRSDEFRMVVRLLQTRMFYEAFRAFWEIDDDGTESEKVLFQKILNDQRPTRNDLPFFRELRKALPLFTSKIVALKCAHTRKGAVSHIVQGWEASLVHGAVALLQAEGIPCFTCFDSVGVPLSRAIEARDILNYEIERSLRFRLCVKTGSSRIAGPFGDVPLPGASYPPNWSNAA